MYYNRAILYHEGKKDDIAALADYSRAIELDPRKTEAYVNRANVHRDLKQYEQALAGYATAEALDPAHLNIYRNRGWLYQKLGQTQRAREDYERGLKLEPNDPWLQQAIRALDRPGL